MPCAVTHLFLADRILGHWSDVPDRAPFPVENPELRDAFLHGTMAPDMGFVPGVDRFVSELAHYVQPGELTKNLFREARSGREEAFAWGWASHVLGDVALHPLVGRAVGERLHGDRGLRMNAEEDLPTHVGMEVGLDIRLLLSGVRAEAPPRRPFFRSDEAPLLGRALSATYGLNWKRPTLLTGHRRAVALLKWWPLALRSMGYGGAPAGRPKGVWGRLVGATVSSARAVSGRKSAMRGFLDPILPPHWLVEEVHRFGDEIRERMDALAALGPEALEDRNLETGEPAGVGRGHPPSDRTALRLTSLPTDRPYEPRVSRSRITPAATRS